MEAVISENLLVGHMLIAHEMVIVEYKKMNLTFLKRRNYNLAPEAL